MSPICPYCSSTKNTKSYIPSTIFNGKTFDYLKCKECSVIYLNPFPTDDDYLKMYPTEYQGEIYTLANDNYSDLFQILKEKHPKATRVLDYGCGNAEFIVNAKNKGYNVTGVEYNPDFVSELKILLPELAFYTLSEFHENDSNKFDIIMLNNVLEHLTNPNEILIYLHSKLTEDGLFICIGPVEDNFSIAHVFRKSIFGVRKKISSKLSSHPPYHITFTNVKNQKMIFNNNGFKEVYFSTKEIAWPFPEKHEIKGFKDRILYFIAIFSIYFSKKINRNAGNLFTFIGKKR